MIHTPIKDTILAMTQDCKPSSIAMNQDTLDSLQAEYNEHRKVFSNFPTQTKALTHMLGVKIEIDNSLNDIKICF
jgi:hypothetical protein